MREPHRRMPWAEVPADVRAAVGEMLGAPVVHAVSQSGGFSPGSADRVVTAVGRRAFVKTASAHTNPEVCDIHRREAEIAARLPTSAPVPRLIGFLELGDWVAVAFEEFAGSQPDEPWSEADVLVVLDAYADLAASPVPSDLAVILEGAPEKIAECAGTWGDPAMADGSALGRVPRVLARWVGGRQRELRDLAMAAPGAVAGDRLVHFDARADNVLIGTDRRAVVVDWPWALRGAGWLDAFMLLATVRLSARTTPTMLAHRAFAGMPADAADGVITAIGGHMLVRSQGEPVPGIPTLRAFQLEQAVACLDWVRERRDGG